MKKLLSFVLATVMAVSVFAVSFIPAMAAPSVNSPTGTTAVSKKPTLTVNGKTTKTDIKYSEDKNNGTTSITFTYDGKGDVTGWTSNADQLGLVEGTDYTVSANADGTYTIVLLSADAVAAWEAGQFAVDASVKNAGETTTAKSNDGNKSPATGSSTAVVSGAVAAACAGIAVLAATKKKDAE